jgi:hypothetical protein
MSDRFNIDIICGMKYVLHKILNTITITIVITARLEIYAEGES